jgi:F-type H+-transporting ATPase subunit alpha
MKKATGTLRLDLAQYREMKVFTQFSSDLDSATKRALVYGSGLMQLLRQPQHSPYSLAEQVVLLVSAQARLFENKKTDDITALASNLLREFRAKKPLLLKTLTDSGALDDTQKQQIIDFAKEVLA